MSFRGTLEKLGAEKFSVLFSILSGAWVSHGTTGFVMKTTLCFSKSLLFSITRIRRARISRVFFYMSYLIFSFPSILFLYPTASTRSVKRHRAAMSWRNCCNFFLSYFLTPAPGLLAYSLLSLLATWVLLQKLGNTVVKALVIRLSDEQHGEMTKMEESGLPV